MRVFVATTVLFGLVLFGYASFGGAASAQGQSVLTKGEQVQLRLANDSFHGCTVVEVRGDFVQCEIAGQSAPVGQTGSQRWYNLQQVMTIEKPAKRE